jgi:quercetin dioxygenase-like cupin family protein
MGGELVSTTSCSSARTSDDRVVVNRDGDSLLVPAGAVHWYRNEGDQRGAFICNVPHGKDDIQLVE